MKALVFLADGFEECEGLIVVDILRRAGVETTIASIMGQLEVNSSRNIIVKADTLIEDVDFTCIDLIILPGGRSGTENLGKNEIVKEKCIEFGLKKKVAAICAAPSILAKIGLLDGKKASCHPDYINMMQGAQITGESVTVVDNIVTGEGLGATFEFAFELVRMLVGEAKVHEIKKAICYRHNAD